MLYAMLLLRAEEKQLHFSETSVAVAKQQLM